MIRTALLIFCLLSASLPIVATATAAAAPSAAAASYAQREDVQVFINAMQSRHGLDAQHLTVLFAKTRPLSSVLKAIKPPVDPGIRSWAAYRQRFIEPRRIAAGLEFWRQHQATLAKAEALTGVPAEIIVAIIGIESFYGGYLGRFNSFAALATLAFDYPPRAELFRRELEALLLLAQEEGRSADSYRGSYAGAIGLPQFLPSSIRAYAVDFDNSGRIDLVGSATDAIGSAANFLKEHGWQTGGPIAIEVKVGAGGTASDGSSHEALLAEGILPRRLPAEMTAYGVAAPSHAPSAPAALIDLVTPRAATEFWLGYQNFYVITRYNRSSFYAMTVYQFAQTLKARQLGYTAPVSPQ